MKGRTEWEKKNILEKIYTFLLYPPFVYSISNAFSDFNTSIEFCCLFMKKNERFFLSHFVCAFSHSVFVSVYMLLVSKKYFACVHLFICSAHLGLNYIQLHSKCLLCDGRAQHTHTHIEHIGVCNVVYENSKNPIYTKKYILYAM